MEPEEEEGLLGPSSDLKLYEDDDEREEDPGILDLSGQDLEKLSRAHKEVSLSATTLLLDNNRLLRLDNIHTYQCLEKLSVQNNRLARIFQVGKLCHLKILNLANNSIVAMEGFKELKLLSWLSLASNKIKTIESLTQNIHLEHLDLSKNNIPHISDLSYLRNLKTLLLHENRIGTLRLCDAHLPSGLSTLTLNDNQLTDLTDASNLSNLSGLEQLTLANNPCIIQPEDPSKQFDYRPFVINWCLNVQVLDGIPVGAKESLKAEWMYSQSKGRHFDVGQHKELSEYLLSVCPLHPDENWEEDKKLNLILSKVQEHQESLRKDPSESLSLGNSSPRSNTLPRSSTLKSPRSNMLISKSPRRNSDASRSGGLISSNSVENFRRPGSSNGSLSSRNNNNNNVRSSISRSAPLKKSALGSSSSQMNLCSYPVVLPRKLYDNNRNLNIMTQSLRFPSNNLNYHSMIGSVEKSNDLMTTSLDPSILGDIISNDVVSNSFPKNMNDSRILQQHQQSTASHDAWSKPPRDEENYGLMNRPDVLFNSTEIDQTQSLIYPRLQSKLNTLPESLNSPDVPVPLNLSGKDDPLLSYGMRDSMYQEKADKIANSQQSKSMASLSLEEQLNNKNTEKIVGSGTGNSLVKTNKNDIPSERKNCAIDPKLSGGEEPASVVVLPVSPPSLKECNSLPASLSCKVDPPIEKKRLAPSRKSTSSSSSTNRASSTPSPLSKKESSRGSSRGAGGESSSPRASHTKRRAMPRSQSSRHVGGLESSICRGGSNDSIYSRNAKNNSSRSSSARCGNVTRTTDNGTKGRCMSRSLSVNPTRRSKSIETEKKDKNVREVKDEAKAIRGDDHIKFLTKELQSTKDALEKERKLRALQLDAIQVLWKEVQLMDATRGNPDKPRPSGSNGSKISSRSSEHSIAKLMDTLEIISSSNYCFHKTESTLGGGHQGSGSGSEDTEAVRSLNETCSNLQSQVEQLQGSLRGIVKFMSTFTSVNMEHNRPSSSASQPEGSFASYSNLEQSSVENPPQPEAPFTRRTKLLPAKENSGHIDPVSTSSMASSGESQEENTPNRGGRRRTNALRPTSLVIKKEPALKKLMYGAVKCTGHSSVKEFAEDLVDDVISGTMISLPSFKSSDVTDVSLSLQEDTLDSSTEKDPLNNNNDNTPTPTDRIHSLNSDEHSSHIDTDSLE